MRKVIEGLRRIILAPLAWIRALADSDLGLGEYEGQRGHEHEYKIRERSNEDGRRED